MIPVTTDQEVMDRLNRDLLAYFKAERFTLGPDSEKDPLLAFARVRHRSIPVRPRAVLWSQELRESKQPANIEEALRTIQAEFERGQSLKLRHTRQYFKADFNDPMLSELGIQHLHLGEQDARMDATKTHLMVGGRNELLFSMVTPTHAYFLDVLDHEAFEGEDDDHLLGIIHRNWPQLIEPYRSQLHPQENPPSGRVRAQARKNGLTVPTQIGTDVCFAPGGGSGTDVIVHVDGKPRHKPGTAVAAVDLADRLRHSVWECVDLIARCADRVADELERLVGTRPPSLDLRVPAFQGRQAVILEQNTQALFWVDSEELKMAAKTD